MAATTNDPKTATIRRRREVLNIVAPLNLRPATREKRRLRLTPGLYGMAAAFPTRAAVALSAAIKNLEIHDRCQAGAPFKVAG